MQAMLEAARGDDASPLPNCASASWRCLNPCGDLQASVAAKVQLACKIERDDLAHIVRGGRGVKPSCKRPTASMRY